MRCVEGPTRYLLVSRETGSYECLTFCVTGLLSMAKRAGCYIKCTDLLLADNIVANLNNIITTLLVFFAKHAAVGF